MTDDDYLSWSIGYESFTISSDHGPMYQAGLTMPALFSAYQSLLPCKKRAHFWLYYFRSSKINSGEQIAIWDSVTFTKTYWELMQHTSFLGAKWSADRTHRIKTTASGYGLFMGVRRMRFIR